MSHEHFGGIFDDILDELFGVKKVRMELVG